MDTALAQIKAAAGLRKFFLNSHKTIPSMSARQETLNAEKPASGPIWVSRFSIPAPPERELADLLWRTVQQLGDGDEIIEKPEYARMIGANWTGHRPGVAAGEPEPRTSELDKYQELMAATGSAKTIFFLQGGSFAFGSPVTARPFVSKLSLSTKLRVLTVAYRLAPVHTFPAFLLDALVAYFTLLSPPPGSMHDPVSAADIVLAGESAGGSLALAIVQTLLHLRRNGVESINFNHRTVAVALPAGVAALSPPGDLTISRLPSNDRFRETDWSWTVGPWLAPNCPADEHWPSNPPRGEIYADTSALAHPLLSLAAARDWTDAPPMFITTGQEALSDGTSIIAQTAAQNHVPVRFMQYEGMPHLFMTFLPGLPQSSHLIESCAKFCLDTLDESRRPKRSMGTFFKLGAMEPMTLDMNRLLTTSFEEVQRILKAGRKSRMAWVWSGPTSTKEPTSPHKL